jgi:lysyl-tRNA synthetase class 1
MALTVPASIEAVIQDFDRSACPFDVHAVGQALATARTALGQVGDAENIGAWSEVLAFTLAEGRSYGGPSPWGTYFCPFMSVKNAAGETVYQPDISKADGAVVDHWRERARSLANPALRARYADLVWDLGPKIAGSRREVEVARLSVDAYVASAHVLPEVLGKFTAVLRALDLAIVIQDGERVELSRAALLQLHREAVDEGHGLSWFAWDRLMTERNAGVTDAERDQLVADLERLVLLYGDTSPERFNPHFLQHAAERLIRHYTRLCRGGHVRRLHEVIARAFEHHAGLSDAFLASAVLQTAVNSYREAGLAEESRRVRMLMEEKIRQAAGEMVPIETEIKIPKDAIEEFLEAVVLENLEQTFVRVAVEFLPKRSRLEAAVQKTSEDAPLMALTPMRIMADDHVAGMVGASGRKWPTTDGNDPS